MVGHCRFDAAHTMQVPAAGLASSRSSLIGLPHTPHVPYVPESNLVTAASISSRCCCARRTRASICDRSKAIVDPSGSCSASALVSREAATTESKSRLRSAKLSRACWFSAASRSRALLMSVILSRAPHALRRRRLSSCSARELTVASAGEDGQDPLHVVCELGHVVAQEGGGLFVDHLAVVREHLRGVVDVGLR
jgi:hypothetical protein